MIWRKKIKKLVKKVFPKILSNQQKYAGFSLVEALMAIAGLTIVGAAGIVAATNTMKYERSAKENSALQVEVEKTLKTTADKFSSFANVEQGGDYDSTLALMSNDIETAFINKVSRSDFKYSILVARNLDAFEMIYVTEEDGQPKLFAFGPDRNVDGTPKSSDPNDWTPKELVDISPDQGEDTECPNERPQLSPNTGTLLGAHACLNNTGEEAELHIVKKGTNPFSGGEKEKDKQFNVAIIPLGGQPDPAAGPPPGLKSVDCEVFEGVMTCDEDVTLTFTLIADDMACSGSERPVTTAFKINGEYEEYKDANGNTTTEFRANDPDKVLSGSHTVQLPKGSEVSVRSTLLDGCPLKRTTDNPDDEPFVYALKKGDPVPEAIMNMEAVDGQTNVAEYLAPYLNDDGTVNIGQYEILWLFEMWNNPDPTNPYYDLQDNIVISSWY